MKDKLSNITGKIIPLVIKLARYKLFIFVIVMTLLYGFLVFRINILNGQTPSDEEVNAKLKKVTSPNVDQSIVIRIQQMQDNSVEVRSLFNEARNNPFQE